MYLITRTSGNYPEYIKIIYLGPYESKEIPNYKCPATVEICNSVDNVKGWGERVLKLSRENVEKFFPIDSFLDFTFLYFPDTKGIVVLEKLYTRQ